MYILVDNVVTNPRF